MKQIPLTTLASLDPSVNLTTLDSTAEVSFIPMADVSDHGEWTHRQTRRLKEVRAGFTVFQDGDVLVAKITPCMENGKGAFASPLVNGVGFGSTEFHVLRARANANSRFVFHWTRTPQFRLAAATNMIGSAGQQRVQASFYGRFLVPDLPLPDQCRIAAILDTVDEIIRQTELVIDKLKKIKAGLLHDLLTRGIEKDGRLRATSDEAPHLYRDSVIGRIPKDWGIKTIREVSRNKGDYGSGSAAVKYNPDAPRYVRITDITDDGHLNSSTMAGITPTDATPYILKKHDIVFARTGATVGKTYLYRQQDGLCAYAGYLIKFELDPDKCIPEYVFQWTKSYIYWHWVDGMLRQTAQPNINAQEYGRLQIFYPPLQEQKVISNILLESDNLITAEYFSLNKVKHIKTGLMEDLLTGKVRVIDLTKDIDKMLDEMAARRMS